MRALAARLTGRQITDARAAARRICASRCPSGWPSAWWGAGSRASAAAPSTSWPTSTTAQTLLLHLGMSGRLLLDGPPARAARAPDLRLRRRQRAALRRPAPLRHAGPVPAPATSSDHPRLAGLGPGAARCRASTARRWRRRSAAAGAPLKVALMDQRLRRRRRQHLRQREPVSRPPVAAAHARAACGRAQSRRLAAAIRTVLLEAIDAGGSSLRDYVQANGELGVFQDRFRGLRPRGRALPGLRAAGRAAGPGRSRDLLVPALPALRRAALDERLDGGRGDGVNSRPHLIRHPFVPSWHGRAATRRIDGTPWRVRPRRAGPRSGAPAWHTRRSWWRAAARSASSRLNRPKALNALNAQLVAELEPGADDVRSGSRHRGDRAHRLRAGVRRRCRHQGDGRQGLHHRLPGGFHRPLAAGRRHAASR